MVINNSVALFYYSPWWLNFEMAWLCFLRDFQDFSCYHCVVC